MMHTMSREHEMPAGHSAWSDARTRRVWWLAAMWALLWIVASVALAATTWRLNGRDARSAHWLRIHGVRVVATAHATSQSSSSKCPDVPVPVTYSYADIDYRSTVEVDTCGEFVRKGDPVTLLVDPGKPRRFIPADLHTQTEQATLFTAITVAVSPLLLIAAAVRAYRLHRIRRVLQHAAWTQFDATVVRIPQRVIRADKVLVLEHSGSDRVFILPFTLGDNADLAANSTTQLNLAILRDHFVAKLGKRLAPLREITDGPLREAALYPRNQLNEPEA